MKKPTLREYILEIMSDGEERTPFEVMTICHRMGRKWTLTGVRGVITTMTDEGTLIKTDNKRMAQYGHLTHTWKLA